MKKLTEDQRVDYATAKARVLSFLAGLDRQALAAPSQTAYHIWPGHRMRAQGAALAALAILGRMQKEGLAHWRCVTRGTWTDRGWCITAAGRAAAVTGNPEITEKPGNRNRVTR